MNYFPEMITPSVMLEYLFCARFIYFMAVLAIPQYEDKRFKVQKGREVHHYRSLHHKDYLRKRIGVVDKIVERMLYSDQYGFNGKIDEILFLDNGTAAPLDYKFAEWKDIVFEGYQVQLTMYGLLIEENFGKEVKVGYLVYTRSQNHVETVNLGGAIRERTLGYIREIKEIITKGWFPPKKVSKWKCEDCCYRKICV